MIHVVVGGAVRDDHRRADMVQQPGDTFKLIVAVVHAEVGHFQAVVGEANDCTRRRSLGPAT